jgi:hypothetical protein
MAIPATTMLNTAEIFIHDLLEIKRATMEKRSKRGARMYCGRPYVTTRPRS